MSSTTLGLNDVRNNRSCNRQMKTITSEQGFGTTSCQKAGNGILGIDSIDSIVSQVYNPMNLACVICKKFEKHQGALVTAFVLDLGMFEYLYEFLPKDITVRVLNQIPIDSAIEIVERHPNSAFVYDQVDPILYVVRYFSDSKMRDMNSRDPYCIEFNKNVVPKGSVLDFVLRCKKHLSSSDFSTLVKMLC